MYDVIVINNISKTYFKITTKILIFISMKKCLFMSNKKWKVKSKYRDSNSHHPVDQFRYRISVNKGEVMWNILGSVKLNPTWPYNYSLSFEKSCIK